MSYNTLTQTFTGQPAIGMSCWCSIQFAIPGMLYEYYRSRNEIEPGSYSLYCPLGHSFIPAQPNREKEQLKLSVEALRRDRDYQRDKRLATERQLYAQKGVTTKLKKRVGHGVCPVPGCKRHFNNLERHIKGQHPDWQEEK